MALAWVHTLMSLLLDYREALGLGALAEELLALGVPDARPVRIPDAIEALLEDDRALMLGDSDELSREQRDELPDRVVSVTPQLHGRLPGSWLRRSIRGSLLRRTG